LADAESTLIGSGKPEMSLRLFAAETTHILTNLRCPGHQATQEITGFALSRGWGNANQKAISAASTC